ncbi:MAG: YceI family protein [Pseudomonadota bacterium]
MFTRALAAVLIPLSLIASPLGAAEWKLDKSHAHATFMADHLGFSTVQGQFRKFDADIVFDEDNIENAEVKVVIDATSLDTGWPARDKHVKSKDFLDVKNHPEITFVSKTVRLTGENTADVTGDLTIRGVTREEVFKAKMRRLAPSPFNPDQIIAGFEIAGEVDRTNYDMTYGAPAIGVMIPIRIDVQIDKQ